MKNNLVVVRAGLDSIHQAWYNHNRNWDLFVSSYDNRLQPDKNQKYFNFTPGGKYPALYEELTNFDFKKYNYIWIIDDDIKTNCDNINKFFELCEEYNLKIAQPSLTHDSYIAHKITKYVPNSFIRYTNFVEGMVPCFQRDFLVKCLPTFLSSGCGWGIDYLWQQKLESKWDSAIIDFIQVKHCRKIKFLPEYKIEMEKILKENNLNQNHIVYEILYVKGILDENINQFAIS